MEYIMRCLSAECIECREIMPSWCRQVNWGNCGISLVKCAVLCVKDTGKDGYEACALACQNCAVYSVFPSGMTSHSKIARFNWECIGCLRIWGTRWCAFFYRPSDCTGESKTLVAPVARVNKSSGSAARVWDRQTAAVQIGRRNYCGDWCTNWQVAVIGNGELENRLLLLSHLVSFVFQVAIQEIKD